MLLYNNGTKEKAFGSDIVATNMKLAAKNKIEQVLKNCSGILKMKNIYFLLDLHYAFTDINKKCRKSF